MSFQNNGRPRPQFGRQGAGQRTGLYGPPQNSQNPQNPPQPMQGGGAFQGRYPGWGAKPQPTPQPGGGGFQAGGPTDLDSGFHQFGGGGMAGQAVNSMQANAMGPGQHFSQTGPDSQMSGGLPMPAAGQPPNAMQAGGMAGQAIGGAPNMAMGQTMPPNAMQMGAPGMTGMDQLRKLLGAYGGVGQGGGYVPLQQGQTIPMHQGMQPLQQGGLPAGANLQQLLSMFGQSTGPGNTGWNR